jgi:putative acetyltransferase
LIRESRPAEFDDVLYVNRAAFGDESVPELVRGVFDDPSACPILSLVACDGKRVVGHVLFSSARLLCHGPAVQVVILGPLAVAPHVQRTGIGGQLIDEGVRLLTESGVKLVFLAGHPTYYTRHRFEPASPYGLLPPFPITPAEAWMVRALAPGLLGSVHGRVKCADSLDKPEYWRE